MKWVTLICLLLCTLVTESRHLKKRDVDHHSHDIGYVLNLIGDKMFKQITLVISAQTFPECSVEENMKLVEEIAKFAQHCADNEDKAECKKKMMTIFHDKVCAIPDLHKCYSRTSECCSKAEPDRDKCFHANRNFDVGQFQIPDAEAACKKHTEHPEEALHFYINTIALRHPVIYPPEVLGLSEKYNTAITECCAEEEKATCFTNRLVELQKLTHFIEATQKHTCKVLENSPVELTQGLKIAKLSIKHPGAEFGVIINLSAEHVHVSKDCCSGDKIACMLEKLEYTQHMCDNQEKISSSLKVCCDKPVFQRAPCLKKLPNDPAPENLPTLNKFLEDEAVCKNFAENGDNFIATFLHEFAIRHQELHPLNCMRTSKGYKQLLTHCCATENPVECLKTGHEQFQARIKESQDLLKKNCGLLEKVGPHVFMMKKIMDYTPKMPQVSDDTLREIASKMTNIGLTCCSRPENQKMSCSEDKLDLLLGEMCEKQSQTFINDQVRRCCDNPLLERRECFTNLGPDQTFKPSEFNEADFHIGAEICEGSEKEQQTKRLLVLIRFMKQATTMSSENQHAMVEKFTNAREKCCAAPAAEDRKLCFETERPNIIAYLRQQLEL
ncbi:serum albumin-like [Leptodactylus fuscus]|uniref:serum albumin-like n=1 Tax=Leptodactylus fuscus TaxID=238119 RepID=UPI003F4EB4A6